MKQGSNNQAQTVCHRALARTILPERLALDNLMKAQWGHLYEVLCLRGLVDISAARPGTVCHDSHQQQCRLFVLSQWQAVGRFLYTVIVG